MSGTSSIEWTEATWNPVVGCEHVSPGCDNCYAAREASGRLSKTPAYAGLAAGGKFTGEVRLLPERLEQPVRWRRPRRIFVNSMSDLFHKDVPDGYIALVWNIMAQCPQHTFQILTKRHARMRSWVSRWADRSGDRAADRSGGMPPMPRGPQAVRGTYTSGRALLFADMLDSMGEPPEGCAYPLYDWMEGQRFWPTVLPNVWLGVSVEDQHWADIRIPALLDTPAAVRWVSAEPLLGPVDLRSHFAGHCPEHDFPGGFCVQRHHNGVQHLHWVVGGGESGPAARPMHPDWARSLRDQCQAAQVPFLFKQWGEWAPAVAVDPVRRERAPEELAGGEYVCRVGKKAAGRKLDGVIWDEYPKVVLG